MNTAQLRDMISRDVRDAHENLRRGNRIEAKRLYHRAHGRVRELINNINRCVRKHYGRCGLEAAAAIPLFADFERLEKRVEG